jgi:hypothetical protein
VQIFFSVEEVIYMLAKITSLGILGFVVLCTGCTLPCHPYDYNGPVYDSAGNCISDVRAGSILDNGDMHSESAAVGQEVIEENANNSEQGSYMSSQPGQYEGATQLLSVTDRKVGETGQSEQNEPKPLMAQPTRAIRR